MADASIVESNAQNHFDAPEFAEVRRSRSPTSLRELWDVLVRRLIVSIVSGLLLVCVVYCLAAPKQYEARARVELRTRQPSSISLEAGESAASVSILSAPTTLETMADVLRSEQLAWLVIRELKLYDAPGFKGDFAAQFPAFHTETQSGKAFDPAAEAWLLDRFRSGMADGDRSPGDGAQEPGRGHRRRHESELRSRRIRGDAARGELELRTLHPRTGEGGGGWTGCRDSRLDPEGDGPGAAAGEAIAPDLPLYMAITFFVGLWVAVGAAPLVESIQKPAARVAVAVILVTAALTAAHGQLRRYSFSSSQGACSSQRLGGFPSTTSSVGRSQ